MPCIPAAAGTWDCAGPFRSALGALQPGTDVGRVCGVAGGGSPAPLPPEHLPQRPAGRGGRAAAGGCRADGSGAQRARPGEVRAAPLPWLPLGWAEDDPDRAHAPRSPSGLLGTTARGLPPTGSACSTTWPSRPHTPSRSTGCTGVCWAGCRWDPPPRPPHLGLGSWPGVEALPVVSPGRSVCRILIVDWDIHHGQGIQYTFEDDPR